MPPVDIYFVYITIVLALCFDFSNGFHDASNSIATIISTGGLKPHWAVVWAAFFNFIAFIFFRFARGQNYGNWYRLIQYHRYFFYFCCADRRDYVEFNYMVFRITF